MMFMIDLSLVQCSVSTLEIYVKFWFNYSLLRIFFPGCRTGDAYTYIVADSLEKALKVFFDELERVLRPLFYNCLYA